MRIRVLQSIVIKVRYRHDCSGVQHREGVSDAQQQMRLDVVDKLPMVRITAVVSRNNLPNR